MQDAEQKKQLAVNGNVSYNEIFAAGLKALNLKTGAADELKSVVDDDPVVKKRESMLAYHCLYERKGLISWIVFVLHRCRPGTVEEMGSQIGDQRLFQRRSSWYK